MHTDLLDGVAWAVEHKVANVDDVCIMGGSYGGYATLAGLTLTPKAFKCGVALRGEKNICRIQQFIECGSLRLVLQIERANFNAAMQRIIVAARIFSHRVAAKRTRRLNLDKGCAKIGQSARADGAGKIERDADYAYARECGG